MASTVCHRFVQNAWKKERCSNCFKSREEHVSLKREAPVSRRPLTSKSRGIMKTTSTASRRKRTVSFKVDLTEVIGFGGEDWEGPEEEEEDDDERNESSEDDCPSSTEEDKEMDKITKANTEHNANITATATERRRTFTQLMLGQPQKDSDGKKQTLLVSVTPFGQEENEKTPPRRLNKSISHIPIAKNKEILAEARPKVVLTSYSKHKEQSEVISTKKEAKNETEVIKPPLEVNSVVKTKIETKRETVQSQKEEKTVEKIKQLEVETIEQETNDDYEVVETVNNEISVTERREIVEKTELVKSELKVQLSPTSKTPPKRDSSLMSSNILNTTPPVSSNTPTITPSNNTDTCVESSPILNITLTSSTIPPIPNTAPLPPTPAVSSCVSPATTSTSPCPTTPLASLPPANPVAAPTTVIPSPSPTPVNPTPATNPVANHEVSEDSGDSLGPSESREQAGEPDGRADPDIPCEPPALPRSPPPIVAPPPRASFLHGLKGEKQAQQVPTVQDKPKVPSKPDKHTQMVRSPSSDLPPLPVQTQTPNKRRAPNPPSLEDLPLDIDPLPIPLPPTPTQPTPPSFEDDAPGLETPLKKTPTPVVIEHLASEEKRKDKTKSRFSLKKFLRVGGSGSKNLEKTRQEDVKEKLNSAKPRLVIVHPLELNGSAVEVVTPPPNVVEEGLTFATPIKEILPPAPPPRNLSEKRSEDPKPPPKSEEILRKTRTQPSPPKCPPMADNVYANLGEVRSGLVPSKPQRTASMREREALLEQQQIRRKTTLPQENLYERINPPRRHSDESNSVTKGFKPGSFSGSEPDLEIYSPCGSYYGSECEISEGGCSRPCRLRSRKGRSIVHRNLEDNYGAVVVANHEALAQVLEHLHQQTSIQPALRGLQSAQMLRWSDFSVVDSSPSLIVGRRAFHHALWGAHHVTLAVSKEQGSLNKPTGLGAFSLVPVTEFNDLISGKFVPGGEQDGVVQASVAVLPWMQVDTIQSFGATIKSKNSSQPQSPETNRDSCFILLQFVNSLKSLQAQGIEEVPLSLSNFILCHDVDRDTHHRMCLLQGFSEEVCRTDEKEKLGSLCQSATAALEELFPQTKLAILIKTLLKKESAMSLSQVKSILEFSLWGPSDVALGVPIKERELALQRWLDLERATVLHGLVGTRVQLSVLEECHLLFLVRSSAKMMCEASLLLETNGVS